MLAYGEACKQAMITLQGMADHRFSRVSYLPMYFFVKFFFPPNLCFSCFSGLLDSWHVSCSSPTEVFVKGGSYVTSLNKIFVVFVLMTIVK